MGWRLGHQPGLDGLRGIAIALVVICHAWPHTFVSGGHVGVGIFFALSGFLITSLLLGERDRTGTVSFGGFYGRRARRLLPALFVYLTFWFVLAQVIDQPGFRMVPGQVVVVLTYLTNWLMAATVPTSHPAAITWSLSIEEQFYLLWPLTFLLARRWPRVQAGIAVGGIAIAIGLRAAMWDGSQLARWQMYYRTDTHMDSILIGCLLALALHRWGPAALARFGWVGVLGISVILLAHNENFDVLVGLTAVPALACLAIAAACAGGLTWLTWSPLRWLGRRSYALYLWHYPIIVLAAVTGVLPAWAAIVLALVVAEASWWLVERPFQRRRTKVPAPALRRSATPQVG